LIAGSRLARKVAFQGLPEQPWQDCLYGGGDEEHRKQQYQQQAVSYGLHTSKTLLAVINKRHVAGRNRAHLRAGLDL